MIKGIEARDRALRSYAFDAKYQVRTRSNATGKLIDHALAEHVDLDRANGRFFVHKSGQVPAAPSPEIGKKQDWLIFTDDRIGFEGERTKVMSKSLGVDTDGVERGHELRTGKVLRGRVPMWTIDPGLYIGSISGKSVAEYLKSDPYRASPSKDPDVVLAECDYQPHQGDTTGTRWGSKFWIDVSKNLSVVKVELSVKPKGVGPWISYLDASGEDYVEIDGFWLPRRYRVEEHAIPLQTDRHLIKEAVSTLEGWKVNPEFSEGRFRVTFDPGTMVSDGERGTSYQAGAINDGSVARDAREALALKARFEQAQAQPPLPDPPTVRSSWWLAGPALLLLAACGIGWSVLRPSTPASGKGGR